jgi:ATP dependent DNA ligase domain
MRGWAAIAPVIVVGTEPRGHLKAVSLRPGKLACKAAGTLVAGRTRIVPPLSYVRPMSQRTLPAGFIAPCLPTKPISCHPAANGCTRSSTTASASLLARTGAQVRLYSRPGKDLTRRFPLIVETLARLRSRSCIIDGEAVACDDNGIASFDPGDLGLHTRPTKSNGEDYA